jgi:hypothetical protein
MKKYKIIKPYPGSENLGKELERCQIPTRIINDPLFNQYYEEIVEKDYEILSVLLRKSERHVIRKVDLDDSESYIESLVKCDGNSIYSVKRLSDGEVFTVGVNTKYGCIDTFYIKRDCLMVTTVLESMGRHLNHVVLLKKPLFTTEDGVDVFEGDEYWNVNALFNINECSMIRDITSLERIAFNNINSNKSFSTKKAAEDYVLLNRRLLSFGDIQEFLKIKDCNKVLNLAKDRLHHGKD